MKKYKFTDNLGLKIIAVIFAAFLWLIVVNLDNPVSTQTFSEVPVTIINEDIILSAGERDKLKASLYFPGRRRWGSPPVCAWGCIIK